VRVACCETCATCVRSPPIGAPLGELRFGVFVSAMMSVLPPVLRRLYAAHPELAVFVEPGHSVDLCRRVGAGELDAAIVVEPQSRRRKAASGAR
jgi:DNA-binding transcriptional LysR family regulator